MCVGIRDYDQGISRRAGATNPWHFQFATLLFYFFFFTLLLPDERAFHDTAIAKFHSLVSFLRALQRWLFYFLSACSYARYIYLAYMTMSFIALYRYFGFQKVLPGFYRVCTGAFIIVLWQYFNSQIIQSQRTQFLNRNNVGSLKF